MKNLHWTKRLLISFVALIYPWITMITGVPGDGELALLFMITALALYWVCNPFIGRSSEATR